MTSPASGGESVHPDGVIPNNAVVGPLNRGHRRTTLSVVALITLIAFESMAVATVMPIAAGALGGVRTYGLAFSSFFTASLLGTVAAGPWGDARGPRAPLMTGAALFTVGQVLCSIAPDFTALLLGRMLAGGGGGLMGVSLYVVVSATYPDSSRPKMFGYMSAAWVLPAILGPVIAGWMAETLGWRSVFAVVVPLALVVVAVIFAKVPASGTGTLDPTARGRLLRGLALAVGAGALQVGAQNLTTSAAVAVLTTVVGVIGVAAALPGLLPRGTFRAARGLPSVIGVRGLYTAAFFGTESFIPLFLVTERGMSASSAGLALTGGAIGWFTGNTVQSRQLTRLPRYLLLSIGGLLIAVGIGVLVTLVLTGASGWFVIIAWYLAGCGMGLGMATTSVLTLRMAPEDEAGLASSSLQLSDSLGGVLGLAVVGAVFAALHSGGGRDDGLFAALFAGLSVIALLAAGLGARGRPPRTDTTRDEPSVSIR